MSIIQLTLPYRQDPPTEFLQHFFVTLIPFLICPQLLLPEFNIARWHNSKFTPCVLMPETSMHEDNGLVFRENQIWFSRQVFDV